MTNLLKIASGALAAIVLVSIVAVVTPRAVQAVAAQLVQDVDSPPSNAWSGHCILVHSRRCDWHGSIGRPNSMSRQ